MTTDHFRAFNDDALRQFAADEQARAAEHGRRQAIHQSAAALARHEIVRRKRLAKAQRSRETA